MEKFQGQNADSEIASILHEVEVMGANDSEPGQIRNIWERYRIGEISADEAIASVRAIRDSKQDYH